MSLSQTEGVQGHLVQLPHVTLWETEAQDGESVKHGNQLSGLLLPFLHMLTPAHLARHPPSPCIPVTHWHPLLEEEALCQEREARRSFLGFNLPTRQERGQIANCSLAHSSERIQVYKQGGRGLGEPQTSRPNQVSFRHLCTPAWRTQGLGLALIFWTQDTF